MKISLIIILLAIGYTFTNSLPRKKLVFHKKYVLNSLPPAKTRKFTLQGPEKQPHAIVVGGGPAGLLTSICLLSRGYNVSLHEARENPKSTPLGPRAFSLGLNIRGQKALNYFESRSPGLWEKIKQNGIGIDAFFLHIGNKEIKLRKPIPPNTYTSVTTWDADPPPTLMIPRNKLCEAMLDILSYHFSPLGKFNYFFSSRLDNVDLLKKTVCFSDGKVSTYDLLVGTDGVQSAIRTTMNKRTEEIDATTEEKKFISEEVVLPGAYVVMVEPSKRTNTSLQVGAVHAIENPKADFGLFVIPTPSGDGNGTCTLINWKVSDKLPAMLSCVYSTNNPSSNIVSEQDIIYNIKHEIQLNYPRFGVPSDDSVRQLLQQRPSEARTVRCNSYHSTSGSAILLGDSAHSTGGTLGQGANSALLDVVALDRCLEMTGDNISQAIQLYSSYQVPEGLALWKLLQIPSKLSNFLKIFYLASQFFVGLLSKFLKFIPPPTQLLLSQTMTPFTDIVKKNKIWLYFALKKFRKIEYADL